MKTLTHYRAAQEIAKQIRKGDITESCYRYMEKEDVRTIKAHFDVIKTKHWKTLKWHLVLIMEDDVDSMALIAPGLKEYDPLSMLIEL